MPISDDIYTVYLDGRASQRGLTKQAAYQHAEYLAKGILDKKASDKRRAPEIEVKVDRALVHEEDQLYKWASQGG
jgi:hypothetical protein